MLQITNLSVKINEQMILQNCSLTIGAGELHLILGPNGSGKSTLMAVIMGNPLYEVVEGSIIFLGEDLLAMPVHKRSQAGIFLAMQQAQAIPGISVMVFLKELHRIHSGKQLTQEQFLDQIHSLLACVGLPEQVLERSLYDGFSGGEKKRFELLQMLLIKPKLALLDEIDSGVDVDGLQVIMDCIRWLRRASPESSVIVITHYHRMAEHVHPDFVHVIMGGHVAESGDAEIIARIDSRGFGHYGCKH